MPTVQTTFLIEKTYTRVIFFKRLESLIEGPLLTPPTPSPWRYDSMVMFKGFQRGVSPMIFRETSPSRTALQLLVAVLPARSDMTSVVRHMRIYFNIRTIFTGTSVLLAFSAATYAM